MTAKPLDLAQFDGHTPGPWRSDATPESQYADFKVRAGKVVTVADVRFDKSAAPNANLIAAAPALLAECRRQRAQIQALREALGVAAGALDAGLNCGDVVAASKDMDSALLQARAALKVSE